MALRAASLFAGVGGLDLALRIACPDARTVVYLERDAYAAATLVARMEDKALDQAPIWDDITTFDGAAWRGCVDLVMGGFPCQDISAAGRGEGIKEGNRSGLFFELMRVVRQIRPRFVFLENVSMLTVRGLDAVLGSLAEIGFDAEWLCLRASDVGAPHRRERWFCLAYRRHLQPQESKGADGINEQRQEIRRREFVTAGARTGCRDPRGSDAGGNGRDRPATEDPAVDRGDVADRDEPSLQGISDGEAKQSSDQGCGGALAHATHDHWRRGISGTETGTRQDGIGRRGSSGCGDLLADAGSINGKRRPMWIEPGDDSSSELRRISAFPPGPNDHDQWQRILTDHPHLAPAIESGVCVLVDGTAVNLDASRADQLRCCGNGVVALQAAVAFTELLRRVKG